MQKINSSKETMHKNREQKLLLSMAEFLLKEKLITFHEKMLLTKLIREGKE